MARNIRERIQTAALELFTSNYFDVVSVAQICRTAGVSNGVFYNYYESKEAIFRDLLDDFLTRFGADLAMVNDLSEPERLAHFVEVVSGAVRRYAGQVTMFREGQYRKPEYERRLRELYITTAQRVLGRTIDEAEYLFLLSGLRFVSTRSLYHQLPVRTDLLIDYLLNGAIREEVTLDPLELTPEIRDTPEPRDSGEAILEAGIRLFGRNGFFAIQISDIVKEAGYSVGTFYKRFESKETFLAEIVRQIGRRTRRFLTEHVPTHGTALDREIVGMANFLAYFSHHSSYYSIVREAEFVVPLAVKKYYDAFEHGYCERLMMVGEAERSLLANFLMGLSHYLGIEVLFSDRVSDPVDLVLRIGNLIGNGIGARKEIAR